MQEKGGKAGKREGEEAARSVDMVFPSPSMDFTGTDRISTQILYPIPQPMDESHQSVKKDCKARNCVLPGEGVSVAS